MNDSGPQKKVRIPTVSTTGTREMARSTNGPIRSQSGVISPNEKSLGMPSTDHAAARGSNRPTSRPPPSSR